MTGARHRHVSSRAHFKEVRRVRGQRLRERGGQVVWFVDSRTLDPKRLREEDEVGVVRLAVRRAEFRSVGIVEVGRAYGSNRREAEVVEDHPYDGYAELHRRRD